MWSNTSSGSDTTVLLRIAPANFIAETSVRCKKCKNVATRSEHSEKHSYLFLIKT